MTVIAERPRYSCALGGAIPSAASIHRVIPILHAGPGCGMQLFNGQNYVAGWQAAGYVGSSALPSTNTTEREVVFGGEPKLRQIIDSTLEIMDGDLFLVLTGCTADIIGDDVASIVGEYRERGVPVAYASTAGFKGSTYLGYELVWKALVEQVVEPAKTRNPWLVNLFGVVPAQDVFWQGTLEEIARLLRELGLSVNTFYTGRQGVEAVRASSEAAINIILSPWLFGGVAEIYKERFGVPSLRFDGAPVGPTATADFLRQIGLALRLSNEDVETLIEDETGWAYDQMEKASLAFTAFDYRHRLAILGDSNSAIGITRFLANDFSQLPAIVVVTDNPAEAAREAIARALQTLEYGQRPEVIFTSDQWEAWEAVRRVGPTYIIGSSLDKELAQEIGALHLSASFPITDRVILSRTYAGNRGAIALVEDFFAPAMTAL